MIWDELKARGLVRGDPPAGGPLAPLAPPIEATPGPPISTLVRDEAPKRPSAMPVESPGSPEYQALSARLEVLERGIVLVCERLKNDADLPALWP